MIFDDSLECEGTIFRTHGAELISMKKWHDLKLSDIWIPSTLLPNRDLPIRLNRDKPILYHTLEKPKPPVDKLSVYSETDSATKINHYSCEKLSNSEKLQSVYSETDLATKINHYSSEKLSNSEKLLDSLEDISYYKRWEECETTIDENSLQRWEESETAASIGEGNLKRWEKSQTKAVISESDFKRLEESETKVVIDKGDLKRWEESETKTVIGEDNLDGQKECETTTVINNDNLSNYNNESKSNHEIFEIDENSFAGLLEHLCLSDSEAEDEVIESMPALDPLSKDCTMHLENQINEDLFKKDDNATDSSVIINKNYDSIEKSVGLNNNSNKNSFSNELALSCDRFSKIKESDSNTIDVNSKLNKLVNYSDSNDLGEKKFTFENTFESASNHSELLQKQQAILNVAPTSNESHFLNLDVDNNSKIDNICDKSSPKSMFIPEKHGKNILSESDEKRGISFECEQTESNKIWFDSENENIQLITHTYQKLKDEDVVSDTACVNRRKVKKDKKSKKASSNVALCNFFLSESEAKKKNQSAVPDYFKYLMEKEYGPVPSSEKSQCNLPSSETVFPSLPQKSEAEKVDLFGKIEDDVSEELKISLKMVTELLKKKESSCSVTEETENVKPEVDNENILNIIIENIPLGVDNETVESILQNYGNVTRLTLRRYKKYLKADVQICLHPHIEDPEWIIECLNESQPFGVSSGEVLKCYLWK